MTMKTGGQQVDAKRRVDGCLIPPLSHLLQFHFTLRVKAPSYVGQWPSFLKICWTL